MQNTTINLCDQNFLEIKEKITFDNITSLILIKCNLYDIPKEIYTIKNLTLLNLNLNNIHDLKNISYLSNLKQLYLNNNKINNITELYDLKNLEVLSLSNNNIKEITNDVKNFVNLQLLYIDFNDIEKLPFDLIECKNLIYVSFFPQSKKILIPNNVMRFLNRSKTKDFKVYSDRENVHSTSIQTDLKKSLKKLTYENISYIDYIKDTNIKNEIKKNIKEKIVYQPCYLTYEDIFNAVMFRIVNSKYKDEMIHILNEEIENSKNLCFIGKITRLVNTLSGFFEDINIGISDSEQIENIIINCLKKDKNIEENFIREMKERNYDDNIIQFYLKYIREY